MKYVVAIKREKGKIRSLKRVLALTTAVVVILKKNLCGHLNFTIKHKVVFPRVHQNVENVYNRETFIT